MIDHDEFRRELGTLINKYSLENESNTPDWMLAEYLCRCLELYGKTMNSRDIWYGKAKKENN